ncbi:uncharacterized protein LOC121380338 [Gigantopelta aegis]|uniref:uncharacterized protein LOC121380338 n=1 Tax=Gigantopelta aegis TaxID=1735272 RepID=UPI001B88CC49|nr:uncharacterized protein LOC121380338 [Gigantopelta aegis]
MEHPVWIISYLWILFMLLTVQCYPRDSTHSNSDACDRCKPGYYASTGCSRRHKTVCEPCPDGHFTTSWNLLDSCYPCSQCGVGLFQLKTCTKTTDVVCEKCIHGDAVRNKHFLVNCLDMDTDVADMQADYILTTESSNSQKLNNNSDERNNTKYEEKNYFTRVDNKTNGKSNSELETVLYGSDLGLTESSGYVFEEKEVELDFSEFLEKNITVNPSEAVEDQLIPVYAIPPATDRHTHRLADGKENTTYTVDIAEGSGLVVEDSSSGGLPRLEDKETQTDKLLDTDYSGEGILLPNDKEDSDSSNATHYTYWKTHQNKHRLMRSGKDTEKIQLPYGQMKILEQVKKRKRTLTCI